jgi:hypothetical protein
MFKLPRRTHPPLPRSALGGEGLKTGGDAAGAENLHAGDNLAAGSRVVQRTVISIESAGNGLGPPHQNALEAVDFSSAPFGL